MLKDFVQYLVGLKPSTIVKEVDGRTYRVEPGEDGETLAGLVAPPESPVLALKTLTGFVDAFNANIDDFPEEVAVQVVDHLTVQLVSMKADAYGRRQRWLSAVCVDKNPFPFDEYVNPEKFLLALQGGFLPTENVISLQRLASSLTSDNSIGVQDDGLSQVITVKQGTVTRDAVALPPRIELLAYRTFREVDPVSSEFLVRLRGDPGKLPSIGLIQIDADKWKGDT
ncbi:MAG: hypothetical protein ABI072_03390, partial [Edaphobacter sp.]